MQNSHYPHKNLSESITKDNVTWTLGSIVGLTHEKFTSILGRHITIIKNINKAKNKLSKTINVTINYILNVILSCSNCNTCYYCTVYNCHKTMG